MSTYSRAALSRPSRVTPRLARIEYDVRSPWRLPDQRHDGHAHVERLQRAVDAAERHRVEHEVDERDSAPGFPRRRGPAAGRCSAVRGDAAGREQAQIRARSAGLTGENASIARGTRASTSRHSARQRRDSFSGLTNAPMTTASGGDAQRRAVERMLGAPARRAGTDRRSRPSAAASRSGTPGSRAGRRSDR